MNRIEIGNIVEKNGVIGYVMDVIDDIAYIWWSKVGRYRIEPHDISTLRLVEDEEVRV